MLNERIFYPDSVTGIHPACEVDCRIPEQDELLSELDSAFKSTFLKGRIRKPYKLPKNNSDIIELELWQVNQVLSELNWEDLTIENTGYMLVHYAFLEINEKLSFQTLLWRHILFSDLWIESFSNILLLFRNDSKKQKNSLKFKCSKKQQEVLIKCMKKLLEKLEKNDDWEKSNEIKFLKKTIEWWNQN